jgi:hypothetical protein
MRGSVIKEKNISKWHLMTRNTNFIAMLEKRVHDRNKVLNQQKKR